MISMNNQVNKGSYNISIKTIIIREKEQVY